MIAALLLSAALVTPQEAALRARLPEIFAQSAAHYKALDAAAAPLAVSAVELKEGSEKTVLQAPHGFNRKTGKLDMRSIYWWTAGHFPGSLWYLYEATGDGHFRDRALFWTERLAPNQKADTNHDLGFITFCSFGNARRILKTDRYDDILRTTAKTLCGRYHEELGLVRSWGKIGDAKDFLVIPDSMMNLELLEWAGKNGYARADAVARSHATKTMASHFRQDGGTYHVLDYDPRTGRVKEIRQGQGASCLTAWSRGQSWAIYGYTMMYRETKDAAYLAFACKVADYAIAHPNMPEDGVPYWDYGAPGEERDSSAASCMASALLELSTFVPGEDGARYRAFAVKQLASLASPAYFSTGDEIGHFLLKHGTGHKPASSEVDTPLDYGDYYFLEALVRLKRLTPGGPVLADEVPQVAQTVSEAEVAAARASRPAEDASGVRARYGRALMGSWVSDAKVPGKVLFEDAFADGDVLRRWQVSYADGLFDVRDDGRGGKCVWLRAHESDYNCFEMRSETYAAVDPTHPIAVLWETRGGNGGNTPFVRFDFYDENKKTVRGEYQFRTTVEPTQPNLFQRNAHLASARMPSRAKYMRVSFHFSRRKNDAVPGEIANVRIVDLAEEVDRALSGEAAVRAERAAAGERDVLVYCDDNLTASYPVMPAGASAPGRAGDALKLRECPGEKTRATAILWSKTAYEDVTVNFSALCPLPSTLCPLPSTLWSAKTVKAHYQAEGAPNGIMALSADQLLVPELLLNDDDLVIADHANRRNLLKLQADGRTWYGDANTIKPVAWGRRLVPGSLPLYDAKSLQPFDLPAATAKQLALRLSVPADAPAGTYRGEIAFRSAGAVIARLPVELEVLPFTLPRTAETIYDPAREYTMGLYVWARLSDTGEAYYSPYDRSRGQCLNEWRTLIDNGINDPAFIWNSAIVFDDARFRQHLALVREAGFVHTKLHLGASGHLGNDTEPEKLRALQERLKKAMATAKEFGFDEVYFYGFDEAVGERLLSQIPAWDAARAVGAKVMVSGYLQQFRLVGRHMDLCIYSEDPASADPAAWHGVGARLWKYNTPQSGPEDPGIFRRNYGLDIWMRGFDGANTYCDCGGAHSWNDVCDAQQLKAKGKAGNAYRALNMVYPTADGVIETLALTGLESAIKDVRIMTKLRQLLRARPNAEAQAWMDGLKPATDDLVKVRREAIDWIMRINLGKGGGEKVKWVGQGQGERSSE